MRSKLFKSIFLVSVSVCLVCFLAFGVWLSLSGTDIGLLKLFTPLLAVAVLALILSAVLAFWASRSVTSFLEKIDFSRPDERDVEEEIKPLVRRLAEQNRQIRSQMEALDQEHKQQDRMRREFTANVSHELKTPLTSISGFAELLRDGLVRPEDVPRFGGKIYDEAQRLIILVGDILRLSRLEEQSDSVKPEPVALYQAAARVQGQLLPVADRLGLPLLLEGEEAWVPASQQIVEEIIYNLCDNALKYNRPGGFVKITVSHTPEAASVTVSDTGIGIPREEIQRIFERFYRVDKSRSKDVGGTGLGLSIVKHGAASLGATIQLESQLEVGTSVRVTFPKAEKEVP